MKRFFKRKNAIRGDEIEDSIMTATQEEKAIIETPYERKRLEIVWYLIILILVVLAGRVVYLDVFKGEYYAGLSKGNRVRSIIIKAPRGEIKDKFGKVLVRNVPSLDIVLIPRDFPENSEERKVMTQKIAQILNLDQGNVEIILEVQNKDSLDPVLIKENISQEEALLISEKNNELPGILLDRTAIRQYENGAIFSAFIGYDGKITREELNKNKTNGYGMTDYIGKTGLEKSYEKELRGKHGAKQAEVDSLGNVKKNLGVINPEVGSGLILNIDEELQKKIYDSLSGALEGTGTKTAAAVAINPQTGGVLAMVSLPSYDNNLFARGISSEEYQNIISNKNLPLLNRATSGEYPPGSTIKPAIASAALMEKNIDENTTVVDSVGAIYVGSYRFGDWKIHGVTDVRKAIAESCDVFFYSIGGGYGNIKGLGMDNMKKYLNMFGFGETTGIDIYGELKGLVPDPQWKQEKIGEKWYIGDSYISAIGQGFITATPLQIANYTAAVANGGTLYSPKIVNRIEKGDGTMELVSSEIIRKDFINPEVLKIVREGMRQTITAGTAQSLNSLSVPVAGKTGTAQFGNENKTHAWFTSFAPFDNPQIAMVVLIEGVGDSNSSAVPVARAVYDWYFSR